MISTPFVQSTCSRGCDLAFGSYYIEPGDNITSISWFMNTSPSNILKYNPNEDNLLSYTRINVPFTCDCIDGEFLAHVFTYDFESVDTYESVAQQRYANLTTGDWIQRFNVYNRDRVPDGANINVTVNCSCGDGSISKDYVLFVTYPLRPGETLDSVSSAANLSSDLIRSYNPDVNFTQGSGLVYIPARDENGNYPPFKTRKLSLLNPGMTYLLSLSTLKLVSLIPFLANGCELICPKKEMSYSDNIMSQKQPYNIEQEIEYADQDNVLLG
ncbi:hypothetical protein E3N88_08872 [Mikania micrantha]|uniref:LysM domain-containing protein n=1 Tax=Mikania micrantha TaxID=192012 RepID=A0A5N6PJR9_9ASTR|nr:hypothetical protein E3N88_08872 [Mikania micrantha]